MFELILGGFLTALTLFMAWGTYMAEGVSVFGSWIPQDEFRLLLLPKLFFGIMLFIGICLLVLGIIKYLLSLRTHRKGYDAYGLIVDVSPGSIYFNSEPILYITVLIATEDGGVKRFREAVGLSPEHTVGEYILTRCYKQHVNILDAIDESLVPAGIKDLLKSSAPSMQVS